MKDFMSQAKGLTKNPLGIIALFISLIYGFACLVLGLSSNSLNTDERVLLIYFLIGFPILILGTFIFLVVNHHKKLYAPSDYKDEKNFFKGFENQQGNPVIDSKLKTLETQKTKTEDDNKEKAMASLLKWGSGKGLFALYAVCLAKTNKKKFTLEDLESHSPFLTEDYTHGFLVAASSAGAFSWSVNNEEPLSIGNIHKTISSNIKNVVYKMAEKEDDSEFLYQELKNIEDAFE
ncbi:hypothetical protein G1K66_12135 [Tenacibaculum finnmarkense]|uniref:hypothetical protein n=1 Tax=Tenacibaculum finnmarkense TaxID=2781243 RepID=UPI001EFBF225|nr:hypothetical protein [Tenacibaculum finnmarkense]MCG8814004.1 hypothetical protein [Tenacibaculum finnmarkense]